MIVVERFILLITTESVLIMIQESKDVDVLRHTNCQQVACVTAPIYLLLGQLLPSLVPAIA